MIAFSVVLKPGLPIYEQVVFAVTKAIVSGQLKPGDKFPSVRELSKELQINPNTAQKIVSHLVNENLLEIKPGIGSSIAEPGPVSEAERSELLENEVEKLIVAARRLTIAKDELLEAISRQWDLIG